MTNIQKKAARAEIVSDIEAYLSQRAEGLREEARYNMEYCTADDETGEIDKTHWRYESAVKSNEKADMIEAVIKDLEKF